MSDESAAAPEEERVDVDDPFEISEDVEEAWEDEDVAEGEAPSG